MYEKFNRFHFAADMIFTTTHMIIPVKKVADLEKLSTLVYE